jgi:hypothetical protein
MPYNNQYNSNVAQVVRGYSQKHINRENAVNDFSTSYEIPSMVYGRNLGAQKSRGAWW